VNEFNTWISAWEWISVGPKGNGEQQGPKSIGANPACPKQPA